MEDAMRGFQLVFAVVIMAVPAQAENLIWKREAFPSHCVDVTEKNPEGDYVVYKCATQFGPPMWQIFQESIRQSIGFGIVKNIPYLGASANRGDWPLEWGGVMKGGKFVPKVAIARFNFSTGDTKVSGLSAYRILANGTSCHIDADLSGKDANAKLRHLAQDPKTPCAVDDNIVK
jgi:hypothetical protein